MTAAMTPAGSAPGALHIPHGTTIRASELMALRRFAREAAALFDERHAPLGDQVAPNRGQGMDYAESRQYSPGDDPRRMDWPVTARTGEPHTKVFHVERGHEYMAIVDLRAAMHFGTRSAFKSVVAAHIAILAGWAATATGGRFGAVVMGPQLSLVTPGPATRTVPQLCSVMEHVAGSPPGPGNEPGVLEAIDSALARAANGAHLLLLSDLHDSATAWRQGIMQMAARGVAIPVWICDPFELHLPTDRRYNFVVDTGVRTVDCAHPAMARQHLDYVETRFELLRQSTVSGSASARLVCCGQDLFKALARPLSLPGELHQGASRSHFARWPDNQ